LVKAPSADPAAEKVDPAAVDAALVGSTDRAPSPVTPEPREQMPGLSTQLAAEISGPIAVRLSGLPQVEHDEFRARASVAAAGSSSSHPSGPAGQRPSPITPGGGGPTAVDGGGSTGGGAGSSGSGGGNTMPPAVLVNPDSAPPVFALSELTAPERRITWWYPEVVVGPG
jgi:hypothetical protein